MGPHGNRRAPVRAPVTFGEAELRPDPARPQGWTLLLDGVPQSYVDLADPAERLQVAGEVGPPASHPDAVALLAERPNHVAAEESGAAEDGDQRIHIGLGDHGGPGWSCGARAQPRRLIVLDRDYRND